MACTTIIIRVNKGGGYEKIIWYGLYSDLDIALKNAKTVHQTQSNPDSEGNVIITITAEH